MTNRSLGHRAPLLWIVLPYATGLVAGKCLPLPPVAWLLAGAGLAVALAAVAAWRELQPWGMALCAGIVLAGAASYQLHRQRLPAWDQLPLREARLVLRIDRTFPQAAANRATGLAVIESADAHLRDLTGQRLYYSLNLRKGQTSPARASVVTVTAVLLALPEHPPADTFESYLAESGVNFRFTRGYLTGEVRPPGAYRRFCARAADRFGEILGTGIFAKKPDQARILRAMLLGQKHELSDENRALFLQSGTMHFFAISGLHIGVIAIGIHGLVSLLRLPRGPRFLLSAGALWLYVDITGAAPSAVRAFIMVAFLKASFVLKKPGSPLSALAASAFLVLLLEPMQLFSASFQMSYGIVAALLLLGLPLANLWQSWWAPFADLPKATWNWRQHAVDGSGRFVLGAVAVALSATVVSTITSVAFFKLFTPGGLLANLLLLPAASLAILGGFLALLCGMVHFTAGVILFNHAAAVVLVFIEAVIRRLVELPGVFTAAEYRAPWLGPLALAAVMAVLLHGYATRWTLRRGGWWLAFAVPVLVLIFGVKFI